MDPSSSTSPIASGSSYSQGYNDKVPPTTSSGGDLWTDILKSADRQKGFGRKNLLLLSERHHGRRYLLDQLAAGPSNSKRRTQRKMGKSSLVMGYEVIEIREDVDEDSVPPLSVFYPPSSDPSFLRLLPKTLPPRSLSDTAVVILLDWTKPSSMAKELLNWLLWVDEWASASGGRGEKEDMRERLQSHLQHYCEPPSNTPGGPSLSPGTGGTIPNMSSATYGQLCPLLPLGPGTLTRNPSGIPMTIVCTKADLMDSVGDELGMKGGGWEERTDWVQQVLRTVCLSYGAALFYTASTQPHTYALLRQYVLHRMYTIPPPLNPASEPTISTSTRFPFPHRANVLDRDAVMVPAGWDSFGKLNVLRDGFDPNRVGRAWETSLAGSNREESGDEEGIEDLWAEMIPDTERGPKVVNPDLITTTAEPEQTFLTRQLDILLKDPNRDPRASFRQAAAVTASQDQSGDGRYAGVVGPMGNGGLNLPGVEKAMAEMEGGSADDMKERFARIARNFADYQESSKGGSLPLASPVGVVSPTSTAASPGASTVPNEALHNFFQGLLATRTKTVPNSSASSPGTPAPAGSGLMPPPPIPSVKKSQE